MRRTWMIGAAILLAVALSVALFASASGKKPPEPPGRPDGVPASILLTPDPIAIQCDGEDASTVTVRVTDGGGKPVPDGTEVFFDAVYGFVDPVVAETNRGEASTQARFYEYADNFPGLTEVDVTVGPLRASIGIDCLPPAPPCGPDASPPCPTPTPCGGVFSPPCSTPTPVPCEPAFSPPCVFTRTPTPTPGCFPQSPPCEPCGGPMSPPCEPCPHPLSPPCITPPPTATPRPLICSPDPGPTPTPAPSGIEYELFAMAGPSNGVIDVSVGVTNFSGPAPNFDFVRWHLCYDPAMVALTSVEPLADVDLLCDDGDDNGTRVLLSCSGAGALTSFRAYYWLRFDCLDTGLAQFDMVMSGDEGSIIERDGVNPGRSVSANDAYCSSLASPTPTPCNPTPCPPTATPTPFGTGTVRFTSYAPVTASVGQSFNLTLEAVDPSIPYEGYEYRILTSAIAPILGHAPIAANGMTLCSPPFDVGSPDHSYYGGCLHPTGLDVHYEGALTTITFSCVAPGVVAIGLISDNVFPTGLIARGGAGFGEFDGSTVDVTCIAATPARQNGRRPQL